MVIAMVAVRVVKVAIDQKVRVIAMRNRLVAAAGTMLIRVVSRLGDNLSDRPEVYVTRTPRAVTPVWPLEIAPRREAKIFINRNDFQSALFSR
jgi:hypothetical protein